MLGAPAYLLVLWLQTGPELVFFSAECSTWGFCLALCFDMRSLPASKALSSSKCPLSLQTKLHRLFRLLALSHCPLFLGPPKFFFFSRRRLFFFCLTSSSSTSWIASLSALICLSFRYHSAPHFLIMLRFLLALLGPFFIDLLLSRRLGPSAPMMQFAPSFLQSLLWQTTRFLPCWLQSLFYVDGTFFSKLWAMLQYTYNAW